MTDGQEETQNGWEVLGVRIDPEVRVIAKNYPKTKPLAAAILGEAANQGATMYELEKACELALKMVRNQINISSMVVSEFASNAQTALDGL